MKGFLKRRWHGIPVGIVSAILLVCILCGSVFASYLWWSGTAKVTVDECLSWINLGYDNGDLNGDNEWIVAMKPAESKILNIRIYNSSTAAVGVALTCVEAYTSVDASWTPASDTIAGGGYKDFTLTVTATAAATPTEYTIPLTISRQ
jgi:uncharacterized membrane protein